MHTQTYKNNRCGETNGICSNLISCAVWFYVMCMLYMTMCPCTIVLMYRCTYIPLCPCTVVPTYQLKCYPKMYHCAHISLCPHTIMPNNENRICPHTIVSTYCCAHVPILRSIWVTLTFDLNMGRMVRGHNGTWAHQNMGTVICRHIRLTPCACT